ncbi:MAG: NAD(P)-dependent oxidoreductase [Alphaproteobacteria bacterium]|jgi:nucleoside-diphosphate-sugar epimerase
MRALITGATGYIGTALARHLAGAGWDVHALLRATSDPAQLLAVVPAVECHRPAERDGATSALVATVDPDCVFHLAARIQSSHKADNIRPLIAANITLGVELLEGLAQLNATRSAAPSVLVAAGTYWAHDAGGADAPNSFYAASKRAFEAFMPFYARHANVPCCSLLLYDVYGPHDTRGKLIPALVENALVADSSALAVSPGDQLLDLVHVDDVVRGFVVAADGLRDGSVGPGRYRLDTGERVTLKQLVVAIGAAVGRPPAVEFGARPYPPNQIMVPLETGPRLPGWTATVSLAQGLRTLLPAGPEASS